MNSDLKDYLERCSPAEMDQSSLEELRRAMKQAVPEIAASIRQREELAAHLRIAASTPTRSKKKESD